MPHCLWHQGQPCRENTVSTCKRARDGFPGKIYRKTWENHGKPTVFYHWIGRCPTRHIWESLVIGIISPKLVKNWFYWLETSWNQFIYIYVILWLKNVVNAKCKRNYQLTLFLLGSLCARKRWKKSLRAKYWKKHEKTGGPSVCNHSRKKQEGTVPGDTLKMHI